MPSIAGAGPGRQIHLDRHRDRAAGGDGGQCGVQAAVGEDRPGGCRGPGRAAPGGRSSPRRAPRRPCAAAASRVLRAASPWPGPGPWRGRRAGPARRRADRARCAAGRRRRCPRPPRGPTPARRPGSPAATARAARAPSPGPRAPAPRIDPRRDQRRAAARPGGRRRARTGCPDRCRAVAVAVQLDAAAGRRTPGRPTATAGSVSSRPAVRPERHRDGEGEDRPREVQQRVEQVPPGHPALQHGPHPRHQARLGRPRPAPAPPPPAAAAPRARARSSAPKPRQPARAAGEHRDAEEGDQQARAQRQHRDRVAEDARCSSAGSAADSRTPARSAPRTARAAPPGEVLTAGVPEPAPDRSMVPSVRSVCRGHGCRPFLLSAVVSSGPARTAADTSRVLFAGRRTMGPVSPLRRGFSLPRRRQALG